MFGAGKNAVAASPAIRVKTSKNLLGSEGIYVSPSMLSPDGDSVYGSMNDYFRTMSGGALSIEATVINPIE